MKTLKLLFVLIFPFLCFSQVNEIKFNLQNFNSSLPPRTNISPMSIKLLDSYNNGGPTSYGSILEIYGLGGHQTSQINFGGWDNSKIRYREAFYAQNTWSDWITLLDSKNDVESMGNLKITGNANSYILNGNFGIGITNSTYKLDVNGQVSLGGAMTNHWVFGINAIGSGGSGVWFDYNNAVSNTALIQAETQGTAYRNIGINPYGGNVGIGSIIPDEKLTVKGKIHAEEIKVDLAVPADYVFQKYYTGKSELKSDYAMPTLAEIESFTKENHHLPNVPSAQDIKEKGLQLGEMSNVLLQKVEELTLYVIEQNKKLTEQQKEIEMLKKALSH